LLSDGERAESLAVERATMGREACLDGGTFNLGKTAASAAVFNGIAFCYEM
jgi:hypothetical protein